jgi:hypothetical protein
LPPTAVRGRQAAGDGLGLAGALRRRRDAALRGHERQDRQRPEERAKAFVELPEGYNKQAIAEAAAIARPMPYVPRYDEMDREIQTGLGAVYGGQRTARDAMVEVVQKVNALLAS